MNAHRDPLRILLLVLVSLVGVPEFARAQAFNDFQLSPHDYSAREARDPMSELLRKAEAGEFDFGTESDIALVEKLLVELDIPASSQVLVFSQSSLQRDLIGPSNPRALYFNEQTHLGWMPGGKIEIISFDPDLGGIFFMEDPTPEPGRTVTFARARNCFGCHGGAATNFLPGPLARSNLTSDAGRRLRSVPGHNRLSHSVPFENRWGGYFVTNAPPTLAHFGNAFAERDGREVVVNPAPVGSTTSLANYFDPAKYPVEGSDIVPLLLFDHQIEAHNLLMEGRYRHRQYDYEHEKFEGAVTRKTAADIEVFFDKLVRYLLFADEQPLSGHKIRRNEKFEEDFKRNAIPAGNGASLKDFNLQDRVFQYRLSYLVDSPAFLDTPVEMRKRVYDRLWKILSPAEPLPDFDYFDPGEREAIIEILRDTHPDLPAEWRES